jgi:hypothetical protein
MSSSLTLLSFAVFLRDFLFDSLISEAEMERVSQREKEEKKSHIESFDVMSVDDIEVSLAKGYSSRQRGEDRMKR